MESYLSDYTEPKRFCPRILNLERFWLLNPEPQEVLFSIILNRKGSALQCWTSTGSVSQCWTIESCLFHYTKPKRFCPQILNHRRFCLLNPEPLEVLCSSILNRKGSDERYRILKVLPINAEPYKGFVGRYWTDKVLSYNAELQKGSISQCWTIANFLFDYIKPNKFCPMWVTYQKRIKIFSIFL